jgi:hypothetical protein
LKNLCEASTYLNRIAVPILYERVTVCAKDEYHLENINVAPLVQTYSTPTNLLRHTKELEVVSQFHVVDSDRCIHQRSSDTSDSDEDEEDRPDFNSLAVNLMPLLEGLKDNNLRCFTYVLYSGD